MQCTVLYTFVSWITFGTADYIEAFQPVYLRNTRRPLTSRARDAAVVLPGGRLWLLHGAVLSLPQEDGAPEALCSRGHQLRLPGGSLPRRASPRLGLHPQAGAQPYGPLLQGERGRARPPAQGLRRRHLHRAVSARLECVFMSKNMAPRFLPCDLIKVSRRCQPQSWRYRSSDGKCGKHLFCCGALSDSTVHRNFGRPGVGTTW